MAPGLDRYMVFNAGRHDGFTTPVSQRPFQHAFATASAVGINGVDLVIHCLAATSAPEPVENPRQRSPWLYSDRYGPLPPCFSRASIAPIGDRKQLLIGGTASIVGEDSRHLLDTAGQLDETFRNLAAVVMTARRSEEPVGAALARLIDVRAYVTVEADAGLVREEIARRCPLAARQAAARICRPELVGRNRGGERTTDRPASAGQNHAA
jgi:chorismate lyase/3-hydroxybenzoate synthase